MVINVFKDTLNVALLMVINVFKDTLMLLY